MASIGEEAEAPLTRKLHSVGAQVTTITMANSKPLSLPDGVCELMGSPFSVPLAHESVDALVSTDAIAGIAGGHYSLAVEEWSRVLRPSGWLLCSTALDGYTAGSLNALLSLLGQRFAIQAALLSHQRIWQALHRFLSLPEHHAQSTRQYKWTRAHYLWAWLSMAMQPVRHRLHQAHWLREMLERVSEWVWHDDGATHVIILGRKAR